MSFTRKHLFSTTVLAGVIAFSAAPAWAQVASDDLAVQTQEDEPLPPLNPGPTDPEATELEEIVVTGSRIQRTPANSPVPLIQVQREALLNTGQATVIDYLATIPALSNSLVPSDTTGGVLNIGGLSFANLRSLGSDRTLTLVDGIRHVGSDAGGLAVDTDSVPRLLIENIEIITGGASAVYGADAVAGVVNFILRDDFEGLEIDGNVGQLADDGDPITRRISGLAGVNLFDDRLNVYVHGEYEKIDGVTVSDLSVINDSRIVLGLDADPANPFFGPNNDGVTDIGLFYGARRLDRPQWGSTTLANMQIPSALSNPLIPFANCSGFGVANCHAVDPRYTYWFDGPTARLADFGQRIGNTGANRPFNIGGDGELYNTNEYSFSGPELTPSSENQRFQAGLTYQLADNIEVWGEAKYINEDSVFRSQRSFWDIYIADVFTAPDDVGLNLGTLFTTRLDNAFLPDNLRTAIQNNTFTRYSQPTADAPGQPIGTVALPIALHRGFGVDRSQENTREITRYVGGITGDWDQVGFIDNARASLTYTRGEMNNVNTEVARDNIRFGFGMDSVVDELGEVGSPGEIVCRVQLIAARGLDIRNDNPFKDGDTLDPNSPEVTQCEPLNVFGVGNQSAAALDYIIAEISVRETNIQDAAVASFSGELWDFWGAGPIGFAIGAEYRKEFTEGIGRSADSADRWLLLNRGEDFPASEYETNEYFGELAIPLLRDHWLGEFAEISGSYRTFDYSTAGEGDVYGVNLIYRPVRDITFKTSFNTAFRAPSLGENFQPFAQTFVNGFVDPCDTRQIANLNDAETRTNRIANCAELARQKGALSPTGAPYDFGSMTPTSEDDFLPFYPSGIASVIGGNPDLEPETAESFTFSVALQPRWIPDLSIVLDYYEIEMADVITFFGGPTIANDCVSGPALNPVTCGNQFRNDPDNLSNDPYDNFRVGAPSGDPIGGFIIAPFNRLRRETRGLDFQVNYQFESEDLIGRDFGSFQYSLGGLWLIEQNFYSNPAVPEDFDDVTTSYSYPRVEFASRLTWSPWEQLAITWTADWQVSQDRIKFRDIVPGGNLDNQPIDWYTSGNFTRHDFAVRYSIRDDLTLRAGVTNAFDAELSPEQYDLSLYRNLSTWDLYGRRFYVGFNYAPTFDGIRNMWPF